MQKTLSFLVVNMLLGWMYCIEPLSAQTVSAPVIDTPLTSSHTYFYNGEIIVPYASGHVSVTNNASVKILSTTDVDLLPGFTASVDSGCGEFVAGIRDCPEIQTYKETSPISCYQANDGKIKLITWGGDAPYRFNWQGKNVDGNELRDLSAGSYTVIIIDNSGCTKQDTVFLTEPLPIEIFVTSTNSICHQSIGAALISATGGSGDYNYYWPAIGSKLSSISNLSAGVYEVIVSDSRGCYKKANVSISDSDGPTVTTNVISPITCHGQDNARIVISLPPSVPEPVYPCGTSPDRVAEGTYSFVEQDTNGCVTISSLEIIDPPPITVQLNSTPSICGYGTGIANVNASGGTGGLSYLWSTGSIDSFIVNLHSGQYSVTITDSNGCQTSTAFVISDTDGPSINMKTYEASCANIPDGRLKISTTSGIPPFHFQWSNGIESTDSVYGLSAGNYSIIVTDSQNCLSYSTTELHSPSRMQLSSNVVRVSCDSIGDGEIQLFPSGGVYPYSYFWSTGATSRDIQACEKGIYHVIVTDAMGCSLSQKIVNEPLFPSYVTNCNLNTPYDDAAILALQNSCSTCNPLQSWNNNHELNIISDFGANPDDNLDDEASFEWAEQFIKDVTVNQGCSTQVILNIPAGNVDNLYIVGRQVLGSSISSPPALHFTYMPGHDVMCFQDCNNISILGIPNAIGEKPKLKFRDCMTYGSFDPNTGERHLHCNHTVDYSNSPDCDLNINRNNSPNSQSETDCICMPESRSIRAAYPGTLFSFVYCKNITIQGIELDGNTNMLSVGGYWSSVADGIQLGADGIFLNGCEDVTIENMECHHFGRDGLHIMDDRTIPNAEMRIRILSSKFNWNCRDGLSWISGNFLFAANSEFNYNGFGPWGGSAAADGVDIEMEGGQDLRNGSFNTCNFNYNHRNGVESNAGAGSQYTRAYDFTFNSCTFVSSEHGNGAYSYSRNMEFNCCDFFGPVSHAYNASYDPLNERANNFNTKFHFCDFNEEYTEPSTGITNAHTHEHGDCSLSLPVENHGYIIDIYQGDRAVLSNCKIYTNRFNRWCYLTAASGVPENKIDLINNTFINHRIDGRDFDTPGSNLFLAYLENVIVNPYNTAEVNFYNATYCQSYPTDCYWVNACVNSGVEGVFPLPYPNRTGCVRPTTIVAPQVDNTQNICDLIYEDPVQPPYYWEIYNGDCSIYICSNTSPASCPPIPPPSRIADHQVINDSLVHSKTDLAVFPSYAHDYVDVTNLVINQFLEIYSSLGKLQDLFWVENSTMKIDISHYPSGVYYLSTTNRSTKKIVKN